MLHIQMHNISSYSNFNKYLMLRMIPQQDWDTYVGLCDENATCIEPELNGNITVGMKFHKYYFDLPSAESPAPQTTMCDFSARIFGSIGVVTYNRVIQVGLQTNVFQETRIWESKGGDWKNIHFHRSRSE